MEVILLERVAKLGQMGETVKVRDGYARNFLLARGKALRATKDNKERFETQRAQLEARNLERRKEAQTVAEKLNGQSFIDHPPGRRDRRALRLGLDPRPRRDSSRRAASRSTASRSCSTRRSRRSACTPCRSSLHPEVEVTVTINVARSPEEAERQARGETVTTREETNLDDLGLEVGAALAEARRRGA